ncbi:uncharacterized protein LOC113789201 [Dermatophagoides pteronyssinus]|uniref:uncharacterized protein LOC113789201 n=1 Tax=Dermatophagoides pteronyssinus TaxID=6956 RepID=UPI003F673471
MLISKKRKTRDIVLQINGSRIELVNSLKYLGVIIENKNKWNLHLDMISKKSLKLYHQIMRTTGKEWGLSGEVLRTIYTVAIEPILTYACSSWHGVLDFKTKRAKLLSIQRSFAISIIKGYRTISTEAAIVLANIDPLDLKILYCTNRYHLKQGNPTNNCIDLIPFQLRAPFSNRLHPALSTNIESRNCPQHHRIDIFTDGSKIDNQTGCAFAAIENNNIIHSTKLRLADECSVFQAELLAILQAIQWCIANDLDARIHCDSQAAIKAVCSRYTSDDLALTIQRMVNSYNKHICLTWVKAHVGITGNELADTLAKEATKEQSISYDRRPISYGLRVLKLKMLKDWNDRWQTSNKGRITASFFPTIKNRKECRFLPNFVQTQFLTGHGKLGSYLFKMQIRQSDACVCGESQTVEHVLLYCPATLSSRTEAESRIGRSISMGMEKADHIHILDYMMKAFKIL